MVKRTNGRNIHKKREYTYTDIETRDARDFMLSPEVKDFPWIPLSTIGSHQVAVPRDLRHMMMIIPTF
jgi:hypothetical protein